MLSAHLSMILTTQTYLMQMKPHVYNDSNVLVHTRPLFMHAWLSCWFSRIQCRRPSWQSVSFL